MSKTLRISGDYTIDTTNPTTSVVGNVRVVGNLVVDGETTTLNAQELTVDDNEIILNAGETGAGVTAGEAGIKVERGSLPDVGFRWHEPSLSWQLTDENGVYGLGSIVTTSSVDLILDTNPQLGGDLDVNGFKIGSAAGGDVIITADTTGRIIIEKEISLQDVLVTPPEEPGLTKVYSTASVGAGGTGVKYSRDGDTDELVSSNRAIVYSMIF